MYGTLLNAGAVIVGSTIGLLFKRFISQSMQETALKVTGICIMIIGLNGISETMRTADIATGAIKSSGGIFLMVCMVAGAVIGHLLKLSYRFSRLGESIQKLLKMKSGFSQAFISASILYCVGAMAIVGCLNEGMRQDSSFLVLKSSFDFVTSIILSTTLGIGVAFSAVSILICQGALTLLAQYISPYATDYLINNVCMVGYVIVLIIGINFVHKIKLETEDLLPSLLIAILISLFTV
ncbi:DUF554 domain-containing protein [Oscillospiraceae bacterium PP1C4]